ncbi:divergent polysaccharide deacetylase family protein [Treponema peruense]|uniref:Divergent polysaccharide deacetylase family protein n=1 Tax=Treponema peruense TaxID=2787628 RepID=A0A7T3V4G7_9SPIR|nr:divergent polysaccharide deacetylase family protein [Treponema peruense]QQA00446.1 divergent polysaccharide deacetylase family protein [Treponema peruense]
MSVKKSRRPAQKRRPARKRKPKVSLDSKRVTVLAAVIVALCVLFLSLSFVFSRAASSSSAAKNISQKEPASVAVEPAKKLPPAKKKTEPSAKKSTSSSKKAESSDKTVSAKKSTDSAKKTDSAQKKPAAENTASSAAQNAVAKTSVSEKTAAKPSVKEQPHLASAVVPQKPVEELPDRKFNIPKAAPGAKIAFVIDDAGQSVSNLKKYTSLPFDISVAVLPGLSHTKDCAYVVRAAKKELLLHQPMQAENLNLDPGPCAIKPGMSTFEIAQIVKTNLDELGPGVKGMNNHEGSLITGNVIKIGAVLDVAAERGIYFLDSRTTAASMARQAALERDMNIKERDVFIDDIVNRDKMLEQIYRGIGIANKKGKVIMIGHVDKSAGILPQLLSELYPYLKKNGYTVTVPSRL